MVPLYISNGTESIAWLSQWTNVFSHPLGQRCRSTHIMFLCPSLSGFRLVCPSTIFCLIRASLLCFLLWSLLSSRWVFLLHAILPTRISHLLTSHSVPLRLILRLVPGGTCSWRSTPTPSPLRSSVPRRCGTSGRGSLSALPCANHNSSSPPPPTVAA